MTEAEIRRTWQALRKYYPNSSRGSNETMLAYLAALEPFSAAAVNDACKSYVQSGGKYWPDVSDIIDRIPKEAAAEKDKQMRTCSEAEIQANIYAFAAVNDLQIPRNMTLSEARKWMESQPFEPWREGEENGDFV